MKVYRSNDEFFRAVHDLIASLDRDGHVAAAEELRRGLACLNGLTDGWALLLEALESVHAAYAQSFSGNQREAVALIRATARAVVHRR